MISRRGLILGALAAPVVIRTPGILMPVRRTLDEKISLNAQYGLLRGRWRVSSYIVENGEWTQAIIKVPIHDSTVRWSESGGSLGSVGVDQEARGLG